MGGYRVFFYGRNFRHYNFLFGSEILNNFPITTRRILSFLMGDEKTFPLKENIGNWHFSQFLYRPEILDNNDFTHNTYVQGVPA